MGKENGCQEKKAFSRCFCYQASVYQRHIKNQDFQPDYAAAGGSWRFRRYFELDFIAYCCFEEVCISPHCPAAEHRRTDRAHELPARGEL